MKKLTILAAVLLFASFASANSILPSAPVVAPSGSNFSWTYSVILTDGDTVKTGNSFTFFDFNGFVTALTSASGWAPSSALTGPSYGGLAPVDSASIPNVTFTYTGANIVASGANVTLGTFTIISKYGNAAVLQNDFTGSQFRNTDGALDHNITSYQAPSVPEPASLMLLGTGLAGLAGSIRRKLRK